MKVLSEHTRTICAAVFCVALLTFPLNQPSNAQGLVSTGIGVNVKFTPASLVKFQLLDIALSEAGDILVSGGFHSRAALISLSGGMNDSAVISCDIETLDKSGPLKGAMQVLRRSCDGNGHSRTSIMTGEENYSPISLSETQLANNPDDSHIAIVVAYL